jgi:iron complex transport system ATP-binding protein
MIRLAAEHLTLRVGNLLLCRDLSVTLRAGENWAVLGANGSGKTTLLHTLAGLHAPAAGTIELDGLPLSAWPARERARRIGLLFQDYTTGFPTTVLDMVLTGRHPHLGRFTVEGETDRRIANDALEAVGLAGFEQRSLSTLSGGERRRVELATLITQNPPICLLDEPANHLDLRHQAHILRRITERALRPEHANIFVVHDVNAARRLASHALLLFPDGSAVGGAASEIISTGTLEHVYGCRFREIADGGQSYYVPQ